MAGPHTTAVLLASRSKDTDRMAFMAVSSFMRWESHEGWPPVRYIAHGIGRSVRQTQKCLRRLEASGELVVRRRSGASHVYTLGAPLLELAKRIIAGEKGLWERISTGHDHEGHPWRQAADDDAGRPGPDDAVHTEDDDAVHPNSSSTVNEPTPGQTRLVQSKAKQLASELKRVGIKTSPHDKHRLEELVRLGATVDLVANAVSACANTPEIKNAFAYAAQTLINQLGSIDRSETSVTTAWRDLPWQVVVAMGEELGVGTWHPSTSTEHYPVYKMRVAQAMRIRSAPNDSNEA